MPVTVPAASLASAMEAVGFSSHEQAVATVLARAPGATAGEVAKKTQLHRNQVYRALRSLEAEGLLMADGTRPERFSLAEGVALRSRFEEALRAHLDAAQSLVQAWHGLEDHPGPGFTRTIPAPLVAREMARFQERTIIASFDTWPLTFPPLPAARRQVTLPGRAAGPQVRTLNAGPVRYLLAADACLLLEGPAAFPSGHLLESRAVVTVFEDHFERAWQVAEVATKTA